MELPVGGKIYILQQTFFTVIEWRKRVVNCIRVMMMMIVIIIDLVK